jgi:hypothetical protein
VDHAGRGAGTGPEAGVAEDAEHGVVAEQGVGLEPADAPLPGRPGQLLEQQRAHPPALVGVGHHEGHLGHVGPRPPVVAGHRHQPVGHGGDQREPVVVVDGGEALHLGVRQDGVGAEVAAVDGVGREAGVERHQGGAVAGPDGADVDDAAVGQDGVDLPLGRVGGHRRHDRSLTGPADGDLRP